nr:SP_1767 family glycosyltransferase [Streptococcus loxodontisalivarius]
MESLTYINNHHSSVARFGDGEIDIITGKNIPYQTYDPELAAGLKKILQTPSSEELLVCLPDVFDKMERYNSNARFFWKGHFEQYRDFYEENCHSDWYGSTFISRPYIDLEDKSPADAYFAELKKMWQDRDLLIVEGVTSRSGVGNDLFANAKSISRIICPSHNAYDYYDDILSAIIKHQKNKLVLIMLGPTAKLLSYQLTLLGHQAIDLGHIDSEYEWYQMKATQKVKLNHKHTAESNYDYDITFLEDEAYDQEIIETIGVDLPKAEKNDDKSADKISIIIPVYNVKDYLTRCMESILKQTHDNFEVILVNDGSTDGSASLCQDFVAKDSRVRLIHQENAGPSAARNHALDHVSGDYITFIDSDDFVEETYLENLLVHLKETDSDISATNFSSFNEERKSFLFYHTKENYFKKVYSVQEWLDQEGNMKNNLHLAFVFSPLKLYKAELWEQVRFPVGRLREDDATIYKVYLRANQIAFTNSGPYYYSQRSEGLSRNGMLKDVSSMVSNAEERIALMVMLGYNPEKQIESYLGRLRKCQADALYSGQIALYKDLSAKVDLYDNYKKGN